MTLVDIIKNANSSVVYDDGGPWRQFILDHLDFIASKSQVYSIAPEVMYLYQYDLKRFLKEKMQINEDIAWIVLLLNNLSSDFEFDSPGNFTIPSDRLILQLHLSFVTISNNTVS